MNITVQPGALAGEVAAPASKSEAHRALICAAFASETTDVACSTTSQDIDATISCLEALGARIARTRLGFRVRPVERDPVSGTVAARPGATLDCGESGSTLRFMLPVVCALGSGASLIGRGRLPQRPLSPLYEQLVAHGARLSAQGTSPLEASGRLRPGTFELPGNVSSQYVSGLLLASPLVNGPVEVIVTEPVESRPYIDITASVLRRFGAEVGCVRGEREDGTPSLAWSVRTNGGLVSPGALTVEGDWSNAAFWFAAGALGERGVAVRGLDAGSAQGDRRILAALSLLGAHVLRAPEGAALRPGALRGATLDVRDCPDLVPPLAAVAACAEGATRITGAARLRLKESDRLETVCAAVCALGGSARVAGDDLVIEGSARLSGGEVDAAGDHRIAMMAAVLASRCDRPVTIHGAECVAKSYPSFYEELASLGGVCEKES